MKIYIFFVLYTISWNIFGSISQDSIRKEKRGGTWFIIHKVDEGETIYSISQQHGVSIRHILSQNDLKDMDIKIGQILDIKVPDLNENELSPPPKVEQKNDTEKTNRPTVHVVTTGETLFSIAQRYGIKTADLKKYNQLESDYIYPNLKLRLVSDQPDTTQKQIKLKEEKSKKKESKVPAVSQDKADELGLTNLNEDFQKYLVQTGESLYSISKKVGKNVDSLKIWNKLPSDYLEIGQNIYYKLESGQAQKEIYTHLKPPEKQIIVEKGGFERVVEEGLVAVIEDLETQKFLALHRDIPVGTNMKIRNLMNNLVTHVKVVGQLPDTGLNKKLTIRVSIPAYQQLNILDKRARVEISYYKK